MSAHGNMFDGPLGQLQPMWPGYDSEPVKHSWSSLFTWFRRRGPRHAA